MNGNSYLSGNAVEYLPFDSARFALPSERKVSVSGRGHDMSATGFIWMTCQLLLR